MRRIESTKVTTAVILAGGLGTRLRSVVTDRPKPMAPVAGRPFLEHLLEYWQQQGIRHFVLSVGYRNEIIRRVFGASFAGSSIEYVVETEPLGTGGGLLLCQRRLHFSEPFLLLNGDTYFTVECSALKQQVEHHKADWGFSLFATNDTRRYLAAQLTESGRLYFGTNPISELQTDTYWANGGVYWVHPRALAPFRDYHGQSSLEADIFPEAERMGQIFCGLRCEATFIDIGVPEDYAKAQTMPCFSKTTHSRER